MSIPNLAQPMIVGDGKTEAVRESGSFNLMMQQLIEALQSTITDHGIIPPRLGAALIAQLNLLDIKELRGAYIYNVATEKGMINENGIFKTITTS